MAKEIKSFPFEVKVNHEKRTMEGYASTYTKDLVGDVVTPGAFKKTISERLGKVKFLWQHDPWQPLGKALRMSEDSKGLHVEASISKTQLGNDAITYIDDEVLDSLSIGYDVLQDDYDPKSETRYLKELKLYEFSLVTFPANEMATITGMKEFNELTNILHKTGRMDVTHLLKEGRTLNKQNRELIETAIKALQDVLNIAEPEDNSTQKNDPQPLEIIKELDIDTKELAALLANFKTN